MAWWDDERIEATVTRNFVCSHLKAREVDQLDCTPGFGDGLTNCTYWEWIEKKAKRIFLVLVDLEMTEQIFGMIDSSWDDTDLPINPEQVERLTPRFTKDDALRRLFYFRQFHYILKPLRKGTHVNYHDMDIVPIEVGGGKAKVGQNQSADRVTLPHEPGRVFCRRHIRLGPEHGLSSEDFQDEIESIRGVENEHLVSYWASYIHRNQGYVLFTPLGALSLKSFLSSTPASVKNLDKQVRRYLIMDWIHCLVDTLAFLHSKGLSHGNIRPSTILITEDNHIFYSGFNKLGSELLTGQGEKSAFDQESYNYAAPEQGSRPSTGSKDGRSRQNTLQSLQSPKSPNSPTSDYVFSISRRESMIRSPTTPTVQPTTAYLNAQAADIFSLGCVILELLGFIVKRSSRSFAAHRAAKHKTPGRGGAVPDSSFHRNLGQVESWMAELAEDAVSQRKKKDGDIFLSGVPPVLQMVERMLAMHPAERPTAHEVQMRMYDVLTGTCAVAEPHCVHQYSNWGFNFEGLQIASSPDDMSVAGWSTSSSHRSSDHSRAGRASNMSGGTDSSQGGRARGTWRSSMYMGVAG